MSHPVVSKQVVSYSETPQSLIPAQDAPRHDDRGFPEAGLTLNHRERATLRAIALGHSEISCGTEPDLFIEGLACCDQSTAHRLARLGLVISAREGRYGERVPAKLSEAGIAALQASMGQIIAA